MDVFTLMALAKAHWAAMMTVVNFVGGAGLLLKNHAYKQFAMALLEMGEELAVEELTDPAKRKDLEDTVYDAMPMWAKALVSKDALEHEADKMFAVLATKVQK